MRATQQYSIPERAKIMLRFIRSEVFPALRPLNMFYGTRNDAHSDEAQHALLERERERRAASFHRECDFMSVCDKQMMPPLPGVPTNGAEMSFSNVNHSVIQFIPGTTLVLVSLLANIPFL